MGEWGKVKSELEILFFFLLFYIQVKLSHITSAMIFISLYSGKKQTE